MLDFHQKLKTKEVTYFMENTNQIFWEEKLAEWKSSGQEIHTWCKEQQLDMKNLIIGRTVCMRMEKRLLLPYSLKYSPTAVLRNPDLEEIPAICPRQITVLCFTVREFGSLFQTDFIRIHSFPCCGL